LASRTKTRPPSKSKPPKRSRARKARATKEDSALLYWLAGGLIVLLVVLITLDVETPEIKGWFANREAPPEKLTHMPAKPPVSPQPALEKERRLK
jgi:hypothetical protein